MLKTEKMSPELLVPTMSTVYPGSYSIRSSACPIILNLLMFISDLVTVCDIFNLLQEMLYVHGFMGATCFGQYKGFWENARDQCLYSDKENPDLKNNTTTSNDDQSDSNSEESETSSTNDDAASDN